MTGIESCVNLVELVLEHNRVIHFTWKPFFHALIIFPLGEWQIERIQAIHLAHLKFLNLAFNRISVIGMSCIIFFSTFEYLKNNPQKILIACLH